MPRGWPVPAFRCTLARRRGIFRWERRISTAWLTTLEKAERFILMEYFIVAEGELWSRLHDILRRKAAQGVEVRLLYDDVGCFFKIPDDYYKTLRDEGIQAAVFGPAHRFVSSFYLNYRNHQKIVVIDGQVGYTGGVNAADEYINVNSRLGHWKDVGIRLGGQRGALPVGDFLPDVGVGDPPGG